MENKIIALVGDIVGSRKIKSRLDFDTRLLAVLQDQNQNNPSVLSPYTLIGDEIQAIYSDANHLFTDMIKILATIHPEKMRFSFGVSTLIKPINPLQAIEMDGPAFYLARDGVNELKESGELFTIKTDHQIPEDLINSALSLVSHTMKNWERNRFHIFALLLEGTSAKEIASALDISQQAVYKNIDSGALEVIGKIFSETAELINGGLSDVN